jgi:hypothetical protein
MENLKALGLEQPTSARKLVSGNAAIPSDCGLQIFLRPHQTEALCLSRSPK